MFQEQDQLVLLRSTQGMATWLPNILCPFRYKYDSLSNYTLSGIYLSEKYLYSIGYIWIRVKNNYHK
jgi:hypothetical protein